MSSRLSLVTIPLTPILLVGVGPHKLHIFLHQAMISNYIFVGLRMPRTLRHWQQYHGYHNSSIAPPSKFIRSFMTATICGSLLMLYVV